MSDPFNIVNIVLSMTILFFLRHFLSFQEIAQRTSITTFIPLLNIRQSYLFIMGFLFWALSLIITPINQFLSPQVFLLDILRISFLIASTMYIAHALMYFSILPIRKKRKPPDMVLIDRFRWAGIAVMIGLSLFLIRIGDDSAISNVIAHWIFPVWQLTIIAHTFWILLSSEHPMSWFILIILVSWSASIPAELNQVHSITCITLVLFLLLLLRANFLYVEETFKHANSFKLQKDAMISFLKKLSGSEESQPEKNLGQTPAAHERESYFMGGFDLNRLLQQTLRYGMDLTNASAGAIFVWDDIEQLFMKSKNEPGKGRLLSARVVEGPYPPELEMGYQPNLASRISYIHEVVCSEKIPIGKGIVGLAAKNGISIRITDAGHDKRIQQQYEPFLQIKSMLVVPLKVDDQTVAALSVVNPKNEDARFSPSDEATLSAMAEQAAHTLGSAIMHNSLQAIERLERDMELAKEVQQLLLPKTCPHLEGYDIAAASVPAQEVGGDYYDFFLLDEDRLGIAIADVSGKGIPGALTMATVRSALRALSKQDKTAREMIIELNRFIRPDMRQGTFISMSLAVLRLSTGELQLARAGHEPLLLLKDGQSQFDQITPPGIVLGLVNGDIFAKNTEIQSVQLNEGDTVVLYTDGITEAMNRSLEEFTLERFLYSLKQNRNRNAKDTVKAIRDKITEFSGNIPQHDDLTLVVIKRRPQKANPANRN